MNNYSTQEVIKKPSNSFFYYLEIWRKKQLPVLTNRSKNKPKESHVLFLLKASSSKEVIKKPSNSFLSKFRHLEKKHDINDDLI